MPPPRIMYIECKSDGLSGRARIGRVTFSKSGRSLYYRGQQFGKIGGGSFKANYMSDGHEYWISGCKKRGGDRLYPGMIEIDEDIRIEYWTQIRNEPSRLNEKVIHCDGKYAT